VNRRDALSRSLAKPATLPVLAALLVPAVVGCDSSAAQPAPPTPTAGRPDPKRLAAGLLTKTTALVDAIDAKNTDQINRAKAELSREADSADDALKSETGPAANQVNAALANIRLGLLNNNVDRLSQARDQLQRAQQQ
jgi:hypothetical protein